MKPTSSVGVLRAFTRRRALAVAVVSAGGVGVVCGPAAGAPAPTAQLAASHGSLGGWQPLTAGPKADAQFTAAERAPRALKLTDPTGRGASLITVDLGSRSSVTLSTRVNLQRLRLKIGGVRPLLWTQSVNNTFQQAGVVRTRTGLRWALWRVNARGKRVGMVISKARLPLLRWRNVVFHTTWSNRRARSYLRVNGTVVARTTPVNLRRVTAARGSIGLGEASRPRGGSSMLVRSAVVKGRATAPPVTPAPPAPSPVKQRLTAENDPYSPDFAFNTPIPANAQTDPRSAAIVSQLVENAGISKVGLSADGEVPPVYVAQPTDPLYSVTVGGKRTRFRVPAQAQAGGGADSPLVILDPQHPDFGRDTELRLWQANIGSNSLSASGAGLFHYNNDGAVLNPDGSQSVSVPFAGGGTGAGLSILAGLIRPAQVQSGAIRHALRFAYSAADFTNKYRSPAIRTDQPKGTSTRNPSTAMDMGMRLQLDPSVNCDTRTVPGRPGLETAFLRQVCHALQDYGMIAVDGSSDRVILLMMENSATANWQSVVGPTFNGSYGYIVRAKGSPDDGLNRDDNSGIPWNRMRVVAG